MGEDYARWWDMGMKKITIPVCEEVKVLEWKWKEAAPLRIYKYLIVKVRGEAGWQESRDKVERAEMKEDEKEDEKDEHQTVFLVLGHWGVCPSKPSHDSAASSAVTWRHGSLTGPLIRTAKLQPRAFPSLPLWCLQLAKSKSNTDMENIVTYVENNMILFQHYLVILLVLWHSVNKLRPSS